MNKEFTHEHKSFNIEVLGDVIMKANAIHKETRSLSVVRT